MTVVRTITFIVSLATIAMSFRAIRNAHQARDIYKRLIAQHTPVEDADVLAVIEPVHPIFKGTKIPGRILTALRDAGYRVIHHP